MTASLPVVSDLAHESIAFYRLNWKLLFWVVFLPLAATLGLLLLGGVIAATILSVTGGEITAGRLPLLIPPVLVLVAGLVIINGLGKIGLVKAIQLKGVVTVRELIHQSWPLVWRYTLLQLLVGLVVLAGVVLLVVPSLIFTVWFSFSTIVLVVEGLTGKAAMVQSKRYVQGRFWPIAGRLLVLGIVIAFLAGLGSNATNQTMNVLTQIISVFVFAPLSSIYLFRLYEAVKAS